MSIRPVKRLIMSKPTIEGAGVHLRRAFGFGNTSDFDPFLLLDDFRNDVPDDYLAGFPWHPHRGIETITYVLAGTVEHGDSMGNSGSIGAGDVQWMTAGSGIIHQEMPNGDQQGRMGGFQLWANLPAARKMMNPRYRDVKSAQIPEISLAGGVKIRIICGSVAGVSGPVQDVVIEPEFLDIAVPPGTGFIHPTPEGHTVIAYVIEGKARFGPDNPPTSAAINHQFKFADNTSLVLFSDGEQLTVTTENDPVRFLLISGKPLHEPIAWRGPIVMNTQEELQTAYEELEAGTFIKVAQS
jgi:quercetin 2,3-dioxygenase